MFTGIVEEAGTVRAVTPFRLEVESGTVADDSGVGASVAVNGVCLTIVERNAGSLAFDLSEETLARTSLGRLREGDRVNLERPVTLATRLGGHLVQGHIDAVGEIKDVVPAQQGAVVRIEAGDDVMRYIVEKGSVSVDGVSLTVAGRNGSTFDVSLIPHTLSVTTLGSAKPGDPVNLEVDIIAKYVEGFLARGGQR